MASQGQYNNNLHQDKSINSQFNVEFYHSEGSKDQKFSEVQFDECIGLESTIEVLNYSASDSQFENNTSRGSIYPRKIILKKNVSTNSRPLMDWIEEVSNFSNPLKKMNLLITMKNQIDNQITTVKWNLYGAWPCQWIGPRLSNSATELASETFIFAYEAIRADYA